MSSSFAASSPTSDECLHKDLQSNDRNMSGESEGQLPSHTSSNTTLLYNTALQEFFGKHQQSLSTASNETTAGNIQNNTIKKSQTFPFPEDLLRILKEVAAKGSSSALPWKHDERKRQMDRAGCTNTKTSVNTQDHTIRHPDFYSNQSRRSSGHKRARLSSSVPARPFHSSKSRSNFSSAASTSSRSTTVSTTMVVESKGNISIPIQQKSFLNGNKPPPSSSNNNFFILRPQCSTTGTHPISYQNGLFQSSGSLNRGTSAAASGSEHEDTSQYECDSEGTSATSNSEISFSSIISKRHGLQMGNATSRGSASYTITRRALVREPYSSVREALHTALNQVLDYYYTNRGGYKLSLTEQRIHAVTLENSNSGAKERGLDNTTASSTRSTAINAGEVFQKRKKRLLDLVAPYCDTALLGDTNHNSNNSSSSSSSSSSTLPPFTIQRIAEVLIEPERYYTQTHKLCNCLEKLLLVTSSVSAFGGGIVGDTMQSQQDDSDSVAFSKERSRLRSEFRQRHRKSRRSKTISSNVIGKRKESTIPDADNDDDDDVSEILDAAARAALRNKFDHVGIDQHSEAALANSREVMASRRLTNSPPPPPLSQSALQQLQRNNSHGSHSSSSSPCSSPESTKLILRDGSPTLSPLTAPMLSHPSSSHLQQQQVHASHSMVNSISSGTSLLHPNISPSGTGTTSMFGAFSYLPKDGEGSDTTKSSPASSDLDSESDLDDSDDRSDGSDSEQPQVQQHQHPLNAAQAITLNRQHQQARMQHQQQQHNRQQAPTSGSSASTFGIMDGYNNRSQLQQQQHQDRQLPIAATFGTESAENPNSDRPTGSSSTCKSPRVENSSSKPGV